MKKLVVGLTGGIASGKSTVADMFCEAGAYIVDTDVISRKVSETTASAALYAAFPAAFTGGKLNRARLREIVFADPAARQRLNALLHPLILEETLRQVRASAADVTIVVVPLLYEAGFADYVSPVITVSAPERIRIERLKARDTITEALARQMLAAQLTDAEREARADIVIRNDGSLAELRAQVRRVYCELTDAGGR